MVTGCNIENVSFTPTICAERTAIYKAISEGETDFTGIVVVGGKQESLDEIIYPCGVCLQVMQEFFDPQTFQIVVAKSKLQYEIVLLKELLPYGFSKENLI